MNRFLLTLIAVTVLTSVGYRYLPEISKRNAQDLQLEALKSDIDHQKQLRERYLREESLLKHDPEYIGTVARDKLNLMKKNETIYRIEPAHPEVSRMKRNQ